MAKKKISKSRKKQDKCKRRNRKKPTVANGLLKRAKQWISRHRLRPRKGGTQKGEPRNEKKRRKKGSERKNQGIE